MPKNSTARSEEHETKFRDGARKHRRGGELALVCGARLRSGGPCQNPPIKEGNGRCLSHAGPHAARAFRERQKRRFEAGSISAAEWNRAEARRAANRLGYLWKKNPWLPGSTIDLAEYEPAFRAALGGMDVDSLPPAVADWMRWRYRRTQIDTSNDAAWMKARTRDLPTRMEKAARTPPEARGRFLNGATKPKVWTATSEQGEGYSYRCLPDKPKAPRVKRGKGYVRAGRPRTRPADADEFENLMRVYRENARVLAPIMARTPEETKQILMLRTLRDYLWRPGDLKASKRWMAIVEAAQVR